MGRGESRRVRAEKSLKQGFFGRVFTSYGQIESARKHGAFREFFAGVRTSRVTAKVRRAVSRSFEGSAILRGVRRAAAILPRMTLRSYGMFLFSFGFYVAVVCTIKAIASGGAAFETDALVSGGLAMLLSVPLLLSGKTLADAVASGKLASYLAFDILGYRREEAERDAGKFSRADTMFLFGMVAGLLTFLFSPHRILGAVLSLILLYVVGSKPETGLILLFAGFPFLSDGQLSTLIILIIVSYFVKLACGRRTLHIDTADIFMLLFFALFILASAINYGAGTEHTGSPRRILYIVPYFLVVGLITNKAWRSRLIRALMFGGSALAVVSIFGMFSENIASFAGSSGSAYVNALVDWACERSADAETASYYLAMMMPVMIAYIARRGEGGKRINTAFFAALTLAAAVLTMSRGIWFGALAGVVIMLIILDVRFALLPLAGAVLTPVLMLVLPQSVLDAASSLLDVTGYTTVWRASVRRLSGSIFFDNFIGGIGSGDGLFHAVYDASSPVGASADNAQSLFLQIACELGVFGLLAFLTVVVLLLIKAFTASAVREDKAQKRCSGALGSGFAAVLIAGISGYIWVDDRMMLLFFMFAGVVSAYNSVREDERTAAAAAVGYVSGDGASASIDMV